MSTDSQRPTYSSPSAAKSKVVPPLPMTPTYWVIR